MKDYPLISMSDTPDERTEGIILLEESDYDKVTARLVNGIWYLTDWDIYNLDGVLHWFDRSGYSISNEIINKLADKSTAIKRAEKAEQQRDALLAAVRESTAILNNEGIYSTIVRNNHKLIAEIEGDKP